MTGIIDWGSATRGRGRTIDVKKKNIDEIRKHFGGPISEDEVQLLNDMKGFIEFSLRNGISFLSVMSNLGHDINGLLRYGFDLKEAKRDGFLPKVTGFSEIDEEAVGEVEEPVETE